MKKSYGSLNSGIGWSGQEVNEGYEFFGTEEEMRELMNKHYSDYK